MLLTFIKQKARDYAKNEDGLAMIEFALVLPFLIMLLLGIIESYFMFDAHTKTKRIANTMANLVSQEYLLDEDDADDFLAIADHIMWPGTANGNMEFGVGVFAVGDDVARDTIMVDDVEVENYKLVWGAGSFFNVTNDEGKIEEFIEISEEIAVAMNDLEGEGFECPYVIVSKVRYDYTEHTPFTFYYTGMQLEHDYHYFPRPVDQIRIKDDDDNILIVDGCELAL